MILYLSYVDRKVMIDILIDDEESIKRKKSAMKSIKTFNKKNLLSLITVIHLG